VLGPVFPRGGPNGVLLRRGQRVAEWGNPLQSDMTFSVAKSYIALLAGLAWRDGLIRDLDDKVSARRSVTRPSAAPITARSPGAMLLTRPASGKAPCSARPTASTAA
jgi:hypothetical protein